MHHTQSNLIEIQDKIKNKIKNLELFEYNPKIIAVSKTFHEQDILPLLNYEHCDFGENKVQEALYKWKELKKKYEKVKLHMLGKLQTNKVKYAVEIFDYIHSLDSLKLAKKLTDEIYKQDKKIKIFIQVNLGEEEQKNGINLKDLDNFYYECKKNLNLDIIGLMCLPPQNENPEKFFQKLKECSDKFGLTDLSMGMSNDYDVACKFGSTFLRIGTKIFGERG